MPQNFFLIFRSYHFFFQGCMTGERREENGNIGFLTQGCKSMDACNNMAANNFRGRKDIFNCKTAGRESACFKCCADGNFVTPKFFYQILMKQSFQTCAMKLLQKKLRNLTNWTIQTRLL